MPTHRTPPWKKKPAPADAVARPGAKTVLTPANLAWARARAREAGRRYPNLIDNMAAARRQQEQQQHAAAPRGLRGESA